jgi:putative ABC transport system permease protein
MLMVGIYNITTTVKDNFTKSVSGTDLIVGAKTGDIQLLLYSIFHIGMPSQLMSWESYQFITNHPKVSWTIPFSLGDFHRGYSVVATTSMLFKHYMYSKNNVLSFRFGNGFQAADDVVLGADVARSLGYEIGDQIDLSHGKVQLRSSHHHRKRFKVVGILKKTGTPVDSALFVSLHAMKLLHSSEVHFSDDHDDQHADTHDDHDNYGDDKSQELVIDQPISGVLVGTSSKVQIFAVQQAIQSYGGESLSAILPGLTIVSLWDVIRSIETAFYFITIFVVMISFLGLLLAMVMSLNHRQREMSILRLLGATPLDIFTIILYEAFLVMVAGVVLGIGFTALFVLGLTPWIESTVGMTIDLKILSKDIFTLCAYVVLSGMIVGIIPAVIAYKRSLVDSIKAGL